ncbi:MAG TPA: hydrogenase maturation nickel metallochaperone HypA [Stellaceae bacterium]|nr:hydrogenase maturation nickel metallochaperone HypA [Stellaceae bacterium]
MHETAIVRDIVRRIAELAGATNARRVVRANIWLGAFSHLTADHFREHFAVEARGTVAETASLEIQISTDVTDPHAQQVRLDSLQIDE